MSSLLGDIQQQRRRQDHQPQQRQERVLGNQHYSYNPANPLSSSPISRSTPPTAESSSPSPMDPNFRSVDTPNSLSAFVPGPRTFRSQSEPPPTTIHDVEMDTDYENSAELGPKQQRARSELISRYLLEDPEFDYDTQDKLAVLLEEEYDISQAEADLISPTGSPTIPNFVLAAISNNGKPLSRTVSNASTEIIDPDSQDIMAALPSKGVKVHDYAFKKPISSPVIPAAEIFDQYRALTEVDYRWSQRHRTYPVQGRTLRRLLDMGWLTMEEINSRAHQIDLNELAKYDAQFPTKEAQYPWRPYKTMAKPNMSERMDMLAARKMLWWHIDRLKDKQENRAEWEVDMKRQVARHIANVEDMDRRLQVNGGRWAPELMRGNPPLGAVGNKRRLDGDVEGVSSKSNNEEIDENGVKRRRITPERSLPIPSGSRQRPQYPAYSIQYPHLNLIPPAKQYPAPLHTYNPELYPEAAEAIASQSQSQSRYQSQPASYSYPQSQSQSQSSSQQQQQRPAQPPPRADTPPLDEEEQELNSQSQGRKLVHPRTMRMNGALGRTQTFTQLAV